LSCAGKSSVNKKDGDLMDIKVGDWVRSYSAGIWQVYRIIENYSDFDQINNQLEYCSLIFCKRFLNNSFKRSFKSECCHPVFVDKLESNDLTKLLRFIDKNQDIYKKFADYNPKPVDAIYNASIIAPEGAGEADLSKELADNNEYNILQIIELLKEKNLYASSVPDLSGSEPAKWTAQYVSNDHTIKNNMLSYRFNRVLTF
jgi:hypothetical protein